MEVILFHPPLFSRDGGMAVFWVGVVLGEHWHLNQFFSLELSYLIAVFSRLLLFQLLIFTFCASNCPLHPTEGGGGGKGEERSK